MPPVPPAQRALGLAVAQRRAELNLSQEAISLRSDLHQRWISNIETGKRNPSYTSLRRLAAGLDLTTSELIALAETIEKLDDSGAATPAPTDLRQ
jgi:transcriptional regulator with XRE-family HTH domain